MQVQCPSCSKVLAAPDERAGQVIACPACGGQMQLPPLQAAAASEPAPGGVAPAGAGTKACPYCGETVLQVAKKCKHCGSFLLAGGPLRRPPGAPTAAQRLRRRGSGDGRTALVFGLIGLIPFCTAPVFAALAIVYGLSARKYEAERTVATVGLVLGIIGLVDLVLIGLLAAVQGR